MEIGFKKKSTAFVPDLNPRRTQERRDLDPFIKPPGPKSPFIKVPNNPFVTQPGLPKRDQFDVPQRHFFRDAPLPVITF